MYQLHKHVLCQYFFFYIKTNDKFFPTSTKQSHARVKSQGYVSQRNETQDGWKAGKP